MLYRASAPIIVTVYCLSGCPSFEPALTLTPPPGAPRQVVFGRGQCSHLLVSRADTGLRIWNLKTLTLAARIDVRVTLLAADPSSEYMAAFSASNKREADEGGVVLKQSTRDCHH